MTLARRIAGRISARHRIASYAVWDVAVLVLNVLAFVLVGLQLRAIASRVNDGEWYGYARCAAAVCATVIVFTAFCVVLSTLVLQGLTLRPLMRWLGLRDDGTVTREIHLARAETARAALRLLDGQEPRSPSVDVLRSEYRTRLQAAESRTQPEAAASDDPSLAALQRQTVAAQRDVLRDLRARQQIGDDAYHAVEEEIDLLELTADSRVRPLLCQPRGDHRD